MNDEETLRIELMTVQIDKNRLDIERVRQEMRWEPYKAVAAVIVAGVAAAGLIVGIAHVSAPPPSPVIINLPSAGQSR